MSRGSEEAWQVTFRNFKCFRLCCVFGRTRRVWTVGRASKTGEVTRKGHLIRAFSTIL